MKLLIVGGVAGGASAAARARRLSEDAEILLIERGPDVSFANCGLPYHIGGTIVDRKKLLVVTPERLHERYKLDVRVRSSVEAIDRAAKKLRIRDLASGREYEETYDKLILAPGAAPLRPPIPGIDLPGIYTLRNLQDMDRIKAALDKGVGRAVMIGGGFIGLELVENFVRRGVGTTLVERNDQLLPPFDKEMTTPVSQHLLAKGVALEFGKTAEAFERAPQGLLVRLNSGESLPADLVVLGIGVRPENKLAVESGLEVGPRGGIRVNEYLQTNDPDIYAVGDAIEVRDFVAGVPTQVPLAGPANRQGRIAADNVFGRAVRYRGTQGTAIVGVFDKTAAITGASEKSLLRSGRPFRMVYVHPTHHAGYYPGAEQMTLKLIFDPQSGRVLGAQAVGGAGVDKRIDVSALLATPVAERPFVLDVRTPEEFDAGHIPSAVNIPVDELRNRLSELPRDRQIAAYCQVGQRGYLATRILRQAGLNAANLGGGYKTYELLQPTSPVSASRPMPTRRLAGERMQLSP